ncbi:thaumatin-like protein [Mycena latifolia]|nr:thaumatin-like protein [Mycena latifolia]
MKSLLFALTMLSGVIAQRRIVVINNCPFRIWPALYTSSPERPTHATGWDAPAGSGVTFDVPSYWNGRIWGRRDCDFSINPGPNSCADGGCNGGLLCDPASGTGVPPATLATITVSPVPENDYMAVSLVDGYNLPMRIDNNVGCWAWSGVAGGPSCPVDLVANCPSDLIGPFNASRAPVGCKSAWTVDALSGNAGNSPNCCSGSHNTPATCPASGVSHYSYFKGSCPNAYAYAFDEPSGTAVWRCSSSLNPVYTVTFCP